MLELRKITKDYIVGDDKVHALKEVSLGFRENEMVSILGQSGCGKTTLLNIIGGLDRYTDGDLVINGRSTKYFKPSDWDAYRNQKIGFVFQSYNLIPHLTVLGNVELALTLSGVKKAERQRRAAEALKRVGLEKEMKKRPNQMSGGQMQRVAIARAIVNNPDIILADEPTGALDSETSVQVMDILKEIANDRLVIMVTHNAALAEEYSTRIISMLDGRIVGDTSPVELPEIEEPAAPDVAQADESAGDSASADADGDNAAAAEKNETSEQPAAENKATDAKAEEKLLLKQKKKEQKAITKANKAAMKRTSMSFFTAFGLSWRNLITKKGRTIATSVAGSIGIIGVALVLALANGFNGYIEDMQTSMLAHYPVTVTQITMDVDTMMGNMNGSSAKFEEFPDGNKLIVKNKSTLAAYHFNKITREFDEHVKNIPQNLVIDVTADYSQELYVISKNMNTKSGYGKLDTVNTAVTSMIGTSSSEFQQLLNNRDYVLSQYDVLQGKYPTEANEIALVIGSDNTIKRTTMQSIGLSVPQSTGDAETLELAFDDVIGQELKLVYNDQWFSQRAGDGIYVSFDNSNPTAEQWATLYDDENNMTLKVVGVMRIKESAALALFNSGLVYTPELYKNVLANSKNSEVARAQAADTTKCVHDAFSMSIGSGGSFPMEGANFATVALTLAMTAKPLGLNITADDLRDMALAHVGGSDLPSAYNFYPITFAKKTDMISYIEQYNDEKAEDDTIYTMDAASLVTSTVEDMIDIISYVLIAFAAISLIVSSVMISIITYASVVERTKEIGVLRAVGARKLDIMRVFNAETIIIGLAAGIIGVLFTFIVSFPLSRLFIGISDGAVNTSLVVLAWWHALLLVAISVVLTLIAGMLPARSASKRDPVVALRSE
ncbi:MAG: ABC transporter ATP-binding protein/permease [Roseburia sp.]|nr:ABC transporter ATP-binding protein/permease [Roseburia sp.]